MPEELLALHPDPYLGGLTGEAGMSIRCTRSPPDFAVFERRGVTELKLASSNSQAFDGTTGSRALPGLFLKVSNFGQLCHFGTGIIGLLRRD